MNDTFESPPLRTSENRWDRRIHALLQVESHAMLVQGKVLSLLNKLTVEKFDSISDQIIMWANKSENEKECGTLIQVVRLVFEKATNEAAWSEMYARLCRKMMEQISRKVQDDGIKDNKGKPIAGGQLFRGYLVKRCQEDFERGWVAKKTTAAATAAASQSTENEAIKAFSESNKTEMREGDHKVAIYSDEYYAAQKAKCQGLGLVKFVGELFKLQMLTERVMHECVKKLLGCVVPREEEIESLCKLLTTVGGMLDTPRARAYMNAYFSRMEELTKNTSVTPRMQYMLIDLVELRERRWIPRIAVAAPGSITQFHKNAAAKKDSHARQFNVSRGGSMRGGARDDQSQDVPGRWAVAGSNAAPRAPRKAGDLSNFGMITKGQPMSDTALKRLSRTISEEDAEMYSMIYSLLYGDAAAKLAVQRRRLVTAETRSPADGSEAVFDEVKDA